MYNQSLSNHLKLWGNPQKVFMTQFQNYHRCAPSMVIWLYFYHLALQLFAVSWSYMGMIYVFDKNGVYFQFLAKIPHSEWVHLITISKKGIKLSLVTWWLLYSHNLHCFVSFHAYIMSYYEHERKKGGKI